jgi:hypothetical protein
MKVKELAKWLASFEDQDAEVEVISHLRGSSYYDQGGTATTVPLDVEKHITYTDLRGNPFVEEGCSYHGLRTLLMGELDA